MVQRLSNIIDSWNYCRCCSSSISICHFFLLLGERNNESSVVESLSPSSSPSTMPTDAPTSIPSPRILKVLYDSTDGPNWFTGWDFSSELSFCEFYGITCDNLDQITRIDLYNNGLRGTLPSCWECYHH